MEFFNAHHPDPHMPELFDQADGWFVFEKVILPQWQKSADTERESRATDS